VTTHWVWIGNWVYWTPETHTTSNYNRFTNSHILQFTVAHTNSSVFTIRCLVTYSQQHRFLSFRVQQLLSSLVGNPLTSNPTCKSKCLFTFSTAESSNQISLYSLCMDPTENTISNSSFIVVYLLYSNGSDVMACVLCHCLAITVSSGSTVLALSPHVTITFPYGIYIGASCCVSYIINTHLHGLKHL
jgi:hypothetical protein